MLHKPGDRFVQTSYLPNGTCVKVWCLQVGSAYLQHRVNGPAVIYSNGLYTRPYKQWWLNGKWLHKSFHQQLTRGSNTELLLLMGHGFDEIIEQRLKGKLL